MAGAPEGTVSSLMAASLGDVAVGADDPDDLLRLLAKPQFSGCKEPVDDIVIATDAVIDELAVAQWADDEQRGRLALIEPAGELDIDLVAVVPGADRSPRRVVAADRIAEMQVIDVDASGYGLRRFGLGILPLKRDELVLGVGPGDRRHRGRIRAVERDMIGTPVGGDDEEEPDAREVVDLIRRAGQKAAPIPGDIRSEAFCQQLVQQALTALGGLDIVVCNAGRQQSVPSILDLTTEEFDRTMKTNLYAPFWIIKAAVPHLDPGSAIIGTTSEQAYDPSPDLYAYAQTKAATMNYIKSLAKQLGSKGIRVNGVAPGPIWTPLQISGGAQPGKVVTFGATAPLGRPGQPAELAGI